ncbi:DDB1- and CUL4-associated factor 15 [Stylophora pistillata]|uniref:DDB1-and CUL4-associated factor 15 n=2 Tax=Stylophora pistillata TaxID=50429 RepID=A0A2B4SS48_STYPI|nr:DDB1- and CUL4-associated factor 15 [Stylophora pistillata]
MVAQSPDEAHVVVYGEVRSSRGDQSHQCYVTVCAGPTRHPCAICKNSSLGERAEPCLEHSFVVHFKYDLLHPFPLFNPSINLKIKDTVLFNTGDYLMALQMFTSKSTIKNKQEILNNLFAHEKDHASKLCTFVPSDIVQDTSNTSSDRGEYSKSCLVARKVQVGTQSTKDEKVKYIQEVNFAASSGTDCGAKAEVMSLNCTMQNNVERCKIVSAFTNELEGIHDEQIKVGVSGDFSPTHCSMGVKNCHDLCNKVHGAQGDFFGEGSNQMKCNESPSTANLSFNSTRALGNIGSVNSSQSLTKTEGSSTCTNVSGDSSTTSRVWKENSFHQNSEPGKSDNTHCDFAFSRSYSSFEYNSVTATPVMNNNNLTSSVFKVYEESSNDSRDNELPDLANEFDMYDGSLALTVKKHHGRAPLKQVAKINQSNPNVEMFSVFKTTLRSKKQVMAIQQTTLDIEQCISELIQSHEDLRQSYKSLKDYDVQVITMCPDSGDVITLARLLVFTRVKQESATCGLSVSPSPVLQKVGFIFSWNVWSGDVKILQTLELETCPERTRYTKFNMAAKEASELRAKFSIPHSIPSLVLAFSNHTVFTGKSLKYLGHPFLPLVLVL